MLHFNLAASLAKRRADDRYRKREFSEAVAVDFLRRSPFLFNCQRYPGGRPKNLMKFCGVSAM
eukprot:scaffold31969_cov67-Skeletonema_dohrnii-CCMP3373.AAC.2